MGKIRHWGALPERWRARRLATIGLIWLCASLLYLAISEWRVWSQAEVVPVTASDMGSGLVSALAPVLVVQVLALLVFGFICRGWPLCSAEGRPGRTELLLVAGVTAIAFAVRFAALQEVPYGLWFDTAENGNQALRILRDPAYRPVFIAEATQLPAFFIYLDALSIKWLGAEALAVRVPSALFGTAAVPALWWLGRQLGGPVLGIAAALALATSRWHIDFSRLAISSIVTPFALALALAAALAALRARGQAARVALSMVAGAAVSLGLWSYPAAALIVPAVGGAVALWAVRHWRSQWKVRLPRAAAVLAIAAVTCVVSLGPLIGVAIRDPNTVLQRSQQVAISGDNAAHDVFESAIQHLLMFTVKGDRNGRHNTPGRPELGWMAPLFLAGVGAAAWRFRSGVSLALPGALLLLLTGILTLPFEAPQSHRAVMAVVPASLLVALPIALVWPRHRALGAVLTGALLVAGCVETLDYFRAQLQDSSVYLENSILETEAGRWLRTLGPDVPILAAERFRSYPTVRFLAGDRPSVATPGTAVSEFLPLDGTRPTAVVASFDEPSLFDRARTLYPQAPIQTFGPPLGFGNPLLFTMFVPSQLQEESRGLLAETAGGEVVPVQDVAGSDAVAWSATLRVLSSGDYVVDAGGATVAIDAETVVSAAQPSASVFLARGAHALHMAKGEASAAPYLHISPTATTASGGTDVLLFALPPPGGLLFTWEIQGRPLQALIDSAPRRGFEGTFNEGRPWTAQWRGDLRVAEAGTYAFHVEAITSATLSIDNQVIVRSNGETQVSLSPGWHAIRIDYVDNDPFARLLVSWRPPGEAGFAPIPDELLRPALSLP